MRILILATLLLATLSPAPALSLSGAFSPAEATSGQPLTLAVTASADTSGRYALTLIYPPQLTYMSIEAPIGAACSTFRAHDWETICYTDLVSGTTALFTVRLVAALCRPASSATIRAYLVPNGSFDIFERDFTVGVRAGYCAWLPRV